MVSAWRDFITLPEGDGIVLNEEDIAAADVLTEARNCLDGVGRRVGWKNRSKRLFRNFVMTSYPHFCYNGAVKGGGDWGEA